MTTAPGKKVIKLYPNKQAVSTLDFLVQVVEEFPIQRIQTDRGEEFMAHKVQYRLIDLKIKYRPPLPRSPHRGRESSANAKNGFRGVLRFS